MSESTSRTERAFARVVAGLNAAGVVWIFALMFLVCADIAARTVLDAPIAGVTEMVSLSLVGLVFLQVAYAVYRGRLMQVEIVLQPLGAKRPALKQAWTAVLAAVAAVLFALIAAGAWPDFARAFRTAEFAGVEGIFIIEVWPIKLLVVIGAAAAALESLRQAGAALVRAMRQSEPARWLAPVIVVAVAAIVAALWFGNVAPRAIGVAMLVLVLGSIVLGLPIAIALLGAGFMGLALIKHDFWIAARTLALAADGTISDYVFASVPLFVLMGLFVNVSDIGRDAFRAAQRIFGRVYGGLGVATVAANAVFAAITGISIAAAAIFTKIAVPEMVRQGYTPKFAVGLTAGSSLLGMLIPPSLLLIIYGVLAEVSIGGLFLAAVLPGALLAAAFAIGVIVMAWTLPGFVGQVKESRASAAERSDGGARVFLGMVPVLILIVLVLGGIYGGVFTPTEAGAAGAFAAMLLTLIRRKLNWARLWEVIGETGQVSVSILFLIIAASTFSRMLTLTELPQDMAAFLGTTGLGLPGFLAAYLVLLVVLGTMLDSTSIMLILLPLALPVAKALGLNLIWFGVITTIGVEIGLLTPPFGLSVYVIKASIDDPRIGLGTIFAGALPFVLITLAVTIVLMAFPSISLALL
jgi:C4-dicarboxylate transporter, DctM subunit